MSGESDVVELLRADASCSRQNFDQSVLGSRYVDEAVESALADRDIPDSVGRMIKELLSRDASSEVASAYFAEYNARGTARMRTRMRKSKINVNYTLTDEQIVCLTDYAPEYDLCFRNCEMHDHPMAAAMRVLDHAILTSRVPAKARITDVGGDPLFHIRNGNVNVHCCDPISDVKDDSRRTIRKMTARNMLQEGRVDSEEVKIMLRSYLEDDIQHFCNERVQECEIPSTVITAVHVYDVPLEDWPGIMTKKGASVVEGAMIFPNSFFVHAQGDLPESGVRYEIDTVTDEFKMGFSGSPSWWYRHKWSQLMRYGIDQRISFGSKVFSYKIVERRKDTIFYRILAVEKAKCDGFSFFSRKAEKAFIYPEVKMVEINGFDFDSTGALSTRQVLRRRKFSVAVSLWEALINTAALEFERGALDFQKMFNAYRTLAPRHTINGVLVSGGYSVEPEDLDVVVIHASIVGAMLSTKADRTNRQMTQIAFDVRARLTQSTVRKLIGALGDSIKVLSYSLLRVTRLSSLMGLLNSSLENSELLEFVSEVYDPVIIRVSMDRLHARKYREITITPEEELIATVNSVESENFSKVSADGLIHEVVLAATRDYEMAKYMLDNFKGVLSVYNEQRLNKTVLELAPRIKLSVRSDILPEKAEDGTVGDSAIVSDSATKDGRVKEANWTSIREKRLAAIQECIVEIRHENTVTESLCKRMISSYVIGHSNVNENALLRDAEANGNPDLWLVRKGVLSQRSVKGVPVRDFCHSVAYAQTPILDFDDHFVKVKKHEWYNEANGETEVNFVIDGSHYSGYLLVCDALLIHNGPEILKSLEIALSCPHDYEIKLVEGPPGCGKTYAIIHEYVDGDFVLCPVRESSDDTRSRLQALHPESKDIPKVVKTVDSFLMHGLDGKMSSREFVRILADECFMAHAGKWYAAAALLGVKMIQAYGDTKQIPHIPRVQVPANHVALEYTVREFNPITRRCPADSVAAWADLYGNLVRSTNGITNSLSEVSSVRSIKISKDTCLMGMYQSDKKEIRRLFPGHDKDTSNGKLIVTAHEAEGKTYREVILFRFDRRVRKDKLSLYDQEPHVLVAISRHTKKFVYVRANGLNDLVTKMIANSRNPRRIKDILQVDKAGIPYG